MIQMPSIKRLLLGLFAVLLLEVTAAPAVDASGPVRAKLEFPPGGTFIGVCSFDLNFAIVFNNEYTITWFDSNGNPSRGLTQGRLVVTFTNGSAPSHSVTLNISGPGITTFNADGSQTIVFLGNGVAFFNGDTILSSGRLVVLATDPLLPAQLISASGNQRSLCAMLA